MEELNNTITHHELLDSYRALHMTAVEYAFFSSVFIILTKIDYISS